VSVPIFERTTLKLNKGKTLTILKKNSGERITNITYGGRTIGGYTVDHSELEAGKELVVTTK
jgi:putative alpha-1,2-mannosidase